MSTTIKKSIRSRLHPLYPYLYYTKKLTHDKPDQTYVGTILEFENSKYNNHPTISNKQYYVCLININTTTSYYHLPYTTRSQLRRRFTPPEKVSAAVIVELGYLLPYMEEDRRTEWIIKLQLFNIIKASIHNIT